MLTPFFCYDVPMADWCVRGWYLIVIAVVAFVIYKIVMPKEKKL